MTFAHHLRFISRIAILALLALAWGFAPITSAQEELKLTSEKFEDHVDFYLENTGFGTQTVSFGLGLTNAATTLKSPYTLAIAGKRKAKAFAITQANKRKDWGYSVKYTWTLGNFTATPDAKVAYRLPYPSGKKFLVGQGANGKFSHQGESQYAIDWNMPEGSPVCAAREGIVVAVKHQYAAGGTNKAQFGDKANFIQIQHNDQTIGEYVHLRQNGVSVKLGQRVRAGETIGYSGNTGYSTGPHLHFMVFRAVSGARRQSIPIRFMAEGGSLLALEEGKRYTAP